MAADSKPLHPVLQYLKDNAVVIGLVLIVAASVAYFAYTQNAQAAKPVAQAVPTSLPTAALDSNASTGPTSPSAATVDPAGSTPSAGAAGGAQGAAQPSPSPTPSGRVTLGTEPQAVSAKDWRPYAKDFAAAWVNTADGQEAWLGRLKPLVSEDLYAGFVQTDISTVPAATIDSVSMAEESLAAKTFRAFSTDGPLFDGRVSVQADGSWIVDQIAPPKK